MKLGIIGAGAWGTALSKAFANNFEKIYLYALETDVVQSINTTHKNQRYLPNIKLPMNIEAINNDDKLQECEIVLLVTPTQYIRETIKNFKSLKPSTKILICSKGFEISSKKMISSVIEEVRGFKSNIGVLSGPTFASDVAKNLPSALVLAMENLENAKDIAKMLNTANMRIYYSNDVIGTQLGGAVKNVIAIAAGIINGAELGHNALAGLITRGLTEITSLANHYKAEEQTIFGLSGLGDLVLTATSENSRNFSLGKEIGKLGKYDESIKETLKGVAEGYYTAKALHDIIKENNLSMPICEEVYNICHKGLLLKSSLNALMSREIKKEKL